MKQYIRTVIHEYKKGNKRVVTKTKQGKLFAEVNIITGKGNNSARIVEII